MDAEQRAVAVKARMNELKAQHLPLTRPCSECRFGPIDGSGLGVCEHYANWEISVDPVTGKRRGRVAVTTTEARSVDGLCGPEGLLFESYGLRKVIRWLHLQGGLGAAIFLFAVSMGALLLAAAIFGVAKRYWLL